MNKHLTLKELLKHYGVTKILSIKRDEYFSGYNLRCYCGDIRRNIYYVRFNDG